MATPPGYAAISVQLTHASLARQAYLTFGTDPTSTTPALIGAEIATALNVTGGLKAILDTAVTMSQIRVSLGSDGVTDVIGITPISIAGLNNTTSVPPNCAVLVHKVTATGGRRNRGRLFLPWCVGTGSVDEGGIISGATMTTTQTAITAFYNALSTNNNPMVVLHDAGKSAIPGPTPVTSLAVDNLISTQRRRLGRR